MSLDMKDPIYDAYMKCSFKLNGKSMGKSDFINENAKIIIGLLMKENNGRGIILHPGSDINLYISIILATFNVFLSDDSDNSTLLDQLESGDLVIYQDKRGEFQGFDTEGRIKVKTVEKGTPCMNFIPMSLAYKLRPYRGNAKSLDGRGIRRGSSSRYKFLASLFDLKLNEVKNTLYKSIVVVCDRSEADIFMERMALGLSSQKSLSFGEIFPAAFYTSSDPIHYPGNYAREEPVLKFTNKLSVARELILEDKNISILLINGSKYFVNDSSELESLYNRRSLQKIFMIGDLITGINTLEIKNYENVQVYVWTKKAIKEKITDISSAMNDNSKCY